MYNCKHPFDVQRILDGRYVECIQCGKVLADGEAPLNEVFNKRDYERV